MPQNLSAPARTTAVLLRVPAFLPQVALVIVAVSLYVVWLNHPGTNQTVGALIVAVAAVAAVVFRKHEPLDLASAAAGGAFAVALTSRDYFSFWAAGTSLLVCCALTPRQKSTHLPTVVAAAAAALGILGALLGPTRDGLPALWPVLVALIIVALARSLLTWATRTQQLQSRAHELERRAEASEASAADLERRTQLARELHDSLSHHIASIAVQAEAGQVARSTEALTTIADLSRSALRELEIVLFDLKASPVQPPSSADVDLTTIDSQLAQPLRSHGISVAASIDTMTTDPRVLRATYRIAQEALTNVLRHAEATDVTLTIRDSDRHVHLTIQDNGTGIPQDRSRGNGVPGIVARAAELGGHAEVTQAKPHGTLVSAQLPNEPS